MWRKKSKKNKIKSNNKSNNNQKNNNQRLNNNKHLSKLMYFIDIIVGCEKRRVKKIKLSQIITKKIRYISYQIIRKIKNIN